VAQTVLRTTQALMTGCMGSGERLSRSAHTDHMGAVMMPSRCIDTCCPALIEVQSLCTSAAYPSHVLTPHLRIDHTSRSMLHASIRSSRLLTRFPAGCCSRIVTIYQKLFALCRPCMFRKFSPLA
jgi:hypothetical protein